MSALIGLFGVVLGSVISGIVSYLTNKQNHQNVLLVQQKIFKLENQKVYAQKHEELMNDYLQLLSLSDEVLKLFTDGTIGMVGIPKSLTDKISKFKNSSILKAHLYFPQIVDAQSSFLEKYSDYISAIEEGSRQLEETYSKPLKNARDVYLVELSTPLSQNLLLETTEI